jgi:3-methyl-2-oxobutanoate hydroxymethyltransferase
LGLYDKIHPKFVKQYTDLSNIILKALVEYKEDIKSRKFPEEKHTSHLNEEELTELRKNFKYIDGKRNER